MNPQNYTVVQGDTLSGIAAKYGVNYQDIARVNGISNPNLIFPGQTFKIPAGSSVPNQSVQNPQLAPQSTPQSIPQQSSGGGTPPPYTPNTVNQTVDFGGITWKGQPGGGWTAQTQTGGGAINTSGATNSSQPTFDLVAATNTAYNTPEITTANKAVSDAQTELTIRQQALADKQAEINDNPFYSEARRVGKSQQLTQQANNDMAIIQKKIDDANGKVASLKADAAIKVNAALGQYNINEQAYQTNLSNFNNLLSAGALDHASGNDIATLATQTGIPTSMIQGMIDQSRKKNNPIQIVQATVGNDLQLLGVDSNGKIVQTTTITGAGKQTSTGGAKSKKTDENGLVADDYVNYLMNDIKNKITLKSLIQHYEQYIPIEKIYQMYAQNSPWGAPMETLSEAKSGKYADEPAKK